MASVSLHCSKALSLSLPVSVLVERASSLYGCLPTTRSISPSTRPTSSRRHLVLTLSFSAASLVPPTTSALKAILSLTVPPVLSLAPLLSFPTMVESFRMAPPESCALPMFEVRVSIHAGWRAVGAARTDLTDRYTGNLKSLNELAKQARADHIIHTGDFGFYDDTSLERIADK